MSDISEVGLRAEDRGICPRAEEEKGRQL